MIAQQSAFSRLFGGSTRHYELALRFDPEDWNTSAGHRIRFYRPQRIDGWEAKIERIGKLKFAKRLSLETNRATSFFLEF